MTQSLQPPVNNGGQHINKIQLSARLDQLEAIQHFVNEQAVLASCPDNISLRLGLIVEELVVNIASYAYQDVDGDMEVSCAFSKDEQGTNHFVVIMRDWGTPFNPLNRELVELSDDIELRIPGGVGILLTKEMAHHLEYHYKNGANVLEVGFRY